MHKPVLGIIGGVGPLATTYFMQLLIQKTEAHTDQDNMPMIVINDPQIPDRTSYILDNSEPDPLPELVKVAHWLEDAGADFLAIPCNTAHYFYDSISESVDIPVVNILQETAELIAHKKDKHATVGLMATRGTIASNLYQEYFAQLGMDVKIPADDDQDLLMELIYDCVKANRPYDERVLLNIARGMHDKGCDIVLIGCTELSVIYQNLTQKPIWLIDALDVLAESCCMVYKLAHDEDDACEM